MLVHAVQKVVVVVVVVFIIINHQHAYIHSDYSYLAGRAKLLGETGGGPGQLNDLGHEPGRGACPPRPRCLGGPLPRKGA